MNDSKFILVGEDQKNLSIVKRALNACGYVFVGYTREGNHLLRHVRSCCPSLVIIDVGRNFKTYKEIVEVMDEDLLAACILLMEERNDAVIQFLKRTRICTYLLKPVFEEVIIQLADISTASFRRILDYEEKVKHLNNTLESRKVVEKAKWILVEKDGMTESTAYDAIRKKSRDNRLPMRDVAEAILLTRG